MLVPSQGLCLLLQPFTSFLSFLPFSPELVELEELCHLGMMMKTLMPSYFIHYFDLFCENCVCCLQLNGMPQCLCKSKGIHGMPSELLPYQVTPLGHHAISAINWPTGDFVNLALLMAWGGLAASAEWLDHWWSLNDSWNVHVPDSNTRLQNKYDMKTEYCKECLTCMDKRCVQCCAINIDSSKLTVAATRCINHV